MARLQTGFSLAALVSIAALLNFGPASALPLASMPSAGAPVTLADCQYNSPHCVTGHQPDMSQEYRNEAAMGVENPGCQGDCNQFGFIPDAKRVGSNTPTTGASMPVSSGMRRLH
ncbi:hypothetical protein [Methylocapsa sp. S129]|uniref:hypothetical protein n=1 Tax=Methylocapsa sp. S129 TaxID=1641869 RepID=UPI00131C7D61|nr:hypothetical protein [Methylocapsa sp. S129]